MTEGISWPPGWFRDPTGRHDHRWWDGVAWTGHVADAGVAAVDPIPAPDGPGRSTVAGAHHPASPSGTSDPVAIAALICGILGVPLAFLPFFGLILPIVAIVLALVARSRVRASGRRGDGLAVGGLATGIGGLLIAVGVIVATVVLFAGSEGGFLAILREYLDCLDTLPEEVCRMRLEDRLDRLLG